MVTALEVVVTDPIISRFADRLTAGAPGHRWRFLAGAADDERQQALATADVLVCSTLDAREARAAARARLVQVTGAGTDRVAVDALPAGTAVANTHHHARPIAEHVLMCTLALHRRLLQVDRELRSGIWRTIASDEAVPFHPTLDRLTLGIVGLGGIGAETARLAGALGMDIVAVRRHPDATVPEDVRCRWIGGMQELPRLLGEADVVVVTVPLGPQTEGLLGPAEFAAMRPSAVLVNVSRGPVVDQAALYTALVDGSIAGAALDVWWGAPGPGRTPPTDHPFAELGNVLLTPHHSGHARSTFEARADDIAANVRAVASNGALRNLVRPAAVVPTPRPPAATGAAGAPATVPARDNLNPGSTA